MNTNDILLVARTLQEQHGREPFLEARQAIGRTALAIGNAAGMDRAGVDQLIRWACGSESIPATTAGHQGGERQAFPGIVCPYCKDGDIVLVEQGHERTWDLETSEDLITPYGERGLTAHFHGIEDYSEDGDGDYFTRCSSCLAEFQAPDDEWEWN